MEELLPHSVDLGQERIEEGKYLLTKDNKKFPGVTILSGTFNPTIYWWQMALISAINAGYSVEDIQNIPI